MSIYELDFRGKSTLGVALMALIFLTPFSLNNIYQGRYYLGAGSLAIVLVLAVNAWTISRGRHYPSLTLFGLIPPIIIFLSLALQKQAIIGALWCYPAAISFYFILPERKAWIANIALLGVALPQVWYVIDNPLAARVTATLFAVSAFSAIFVRVISNQQQQMQTLAVTDPLTGVLNRALLHDTLEQASQQSNRTDIPMTLVALDLDHFKAINDSLGHDAGDIVLKGLGEYLRQSVRATDKVFRMGGEEFLVFLYDTSVEGSQQFAEKLRSEIASLKLLPDHPVTVSIGVATLQSGDDRDEWMKHCDNNLYRAKLNGRNQVVA